MEEGGNTGYRHWQLLAVFTKKVRLQGVKSVFGEQAHAELSRSSAASDYVWKEDTRIEGTQFELGVLPICRNSAEDWRRVRELAKAGDLEAIPDDIYIRFYRTLKEIKRDHMIVVPDLEDVCGVWIYGPPGYGKSHKARADYPGAYLKPCNKWWDGYRDHDNVILDDFDKNHSVLGHHLKIWADKYSFIAETKGGAIQIRPKKVVITSNYAIRDIFVDDAVLCEAIERRFRIIHIAIRLF